MRFNTKLCMCPWALRLKKRFGYLGLSLVLPVSLLTFALTDCVGSRVLAQSSLYGGPPGKSEQGNALPTALSDIGIDQKLNEQVPLDLIFRDEGGREVKLEEYFGPRPVILALVYYECPMLCNQVLNGLTNSLRTLSFNAGREFEVVAVSFDPRETPKLAAAKKESYVSRYNRPGTDAGWHFLTGDQRSITSLADAVGFRYRWDAETNQFAHASGIMVLTPQGKIARYFYGIDYAPSNLRLGIVEASEGKVGSAVDQFMLYCYQYDPGTGKYGAVVLNILKLFSVFFLLLMSALFQLLRRWNAHRVRAAGASN